MIAKHVSVPFIHLTKTTNGQVIVIDSKQHLENELQFRFTTPLLVKAIVTKTNEGAMITEARCFNSEILEGMHTTNLMSPYPMYVVVYIFCLILL